MSSQLLKCLFTLLDQKADTPFDLDSLAKVTGYSKYYLCRAFHSATGEPLITYMRRLSLARSAEALRRGERIIDVAFACGYESQEAYHRAFSKMFGVTPSGFQKGRHQQSLMLKKPWSEVMMPSKQLHSYIVEREQFVLYGIGDVFSYEEFDNIFDLWAQFHEKVPRSIISYGVTLNIEDEPDKFRYYAASPIRTNALPLEEITIPKQRYRVFQHIGPATQLMASFNYIWGIWLPSYGEQFTGIDFEKYPPFYEPEKHDSVVEIYFPISK